MRGHGNVVVGRREARDDPRRLHRGERAPADDRARARGPFNYVSPRKARCARRNPGEEGRAWDGWKKKGVAEVREHRA